MIPTLIPPEALRAIPEAIWMKRGNEMTIYRGSPLEIVQTMASEMGDDISVHDAVRYILTNIRESCGVEILLPEGIPEELLAQLFLYALLDRGVGQPMAAA